MKRMITGWIALFTMMLLSGCNMPIHPDYGSDTSWNPNPSITVKILEGNRIANAYDETFSVYLDVEVVAKGQPFLLKTSRFNVRSKFGDHETWFTSNNEGWPTQWKVSAQYGGYRAATPEELVITIQIDDSDHLGYNRKVYRKILYFNWEWEGEGENLVPQVVHEEVAINNLSHLRSNVPRVLFDSVTDW